METCRACNKLTTSVTSLFHPDTKELFEKCTYLNVKLGDKLPPNICNICLQQCKLWQEFQKMCHNNDTLLRETLSHVNLDESMEINIGSSELISFEIENLLNITTVDIIDENLTKKRTKSPNILPIDVKKVKKKRTTSPIELYESNELGDPVNEDIIEDYVETATLPHFKCYQCNINLLTIKSLRNHLIDKHFTNKSLSDSNQLKSKKIIRSVVKKNKLSKKLNKIGNDKSQSTDEIPIENDSPKNLEDKKSSRKKKPSTIKEYKCRRCSKVFSLAGSRSKHELVHGKPMAICSYCGLGFFTNYSLNEHIRVHTNERPFKCKLCPMAFKRCSNLNIHVRKHTNERPYKCNLCTNAYTNNQSLKLHLKMHKKNTELKYSCEICDMKFSTIGSWSNHKQRRHNIGKDSNTPRPQPRELKCEYCPKIFRYYSVLSVHRRIHKNELPFTCKICQQKFRQTQHLNTHIKGVHKLTREEYQDNNK